MGGTRPGMRDDGCLLHGKVEAEGTWVRGHCVEEDALQAQLDKKNAGSDGGYVWGGTTE